MQEMSLNFYLVTQENLCYNLKYIFKHRIYLEIFQIFFFSRSQEATKLRNVRKMNI